MIAQKGDETRKYYAMYNVLEEKKTYVTKEISLINSIHENFTKVMAEKAAAREKLAESVDSTVKSVQATRAKTQARVDDELAAKAALQAKYDKLLGQQRKYFKLVKELKEAYQKQAEAEDAVAAAALLVGSKKGYLVVSHAAAAPPHERSHSSPAYSPPSSAVIALLKSRDAG